MEKNQIDTLLRPETYPEKTTSVTLVQTHISYIFLLDDHVYKFKKSVNFGFLDFSTLEKRRFYCDEELRLNRRLSPDIYLGVAELRRDRHGRLRIDGEGKAVEYAVKMIRLPEQRMMARLLDENVVNATDISALARLVAGFHEKAARNSYIDRFGSIETISANWLENLQQTLPYLDRTITSNNLELIRSWVVKHLIEEEARYRDRVTGGFIRECDGDLHSENICLNDRIYIFDCIEFNEKFRYSDTAADVAFLAMDLENHGKRDLAELFVDEYILASSDRTIRAVLPMYLVNRAFIRGKVESFRLDDPEIPLDEKTAALKRASRFFRLARGYILRDNFPFSLIMTCAPTGCGKSTLATELAFQLGFDHFSSDIVRKNLAGIALTDRSTDIYTAEWNRRTYAQLETVARETLDKGRSVLVDGTFIRRDTRKPFIALAREYGCSLLIIRPVLPDDAVKKRLLARAGDPLTVSDGTWDIYQQQMSILEEPDDSEGTVIRLDANIPVEAIVEEILEAIGLI